MVTGRGHGLILEIMDITTTKERHLLIRGMNNKTKESEGMMLIYTDEKIKLMQDKNLLYKLEFMIVTGSNRLTPCETSQISDMVLSRKDKKCDLVENIDDNIDLDEED